MDITAYREKASTARDMVRGILENENGPPTIEAARLIAEEYVLRGVHIKPECLLNVWMEGQK